MRRWIAGGLALAALLLPGTLAMADDQQWIIPLPTIQDVPIDSATPTPDATPVPEETLTPDETPLPDSTPMPPTSPVPIPTPDPDAPLSAYYDTVIRPQMDLIGDNMRSLFNSQEELESGFSRAKQGIDALEAACQNVEKFTTDEQLMGCIARMKSDIEEGLRRSDGVPGSDETIMGYQQGIAQTLKDFMDRIDVLVNGRPLGDIV